MVHAILFKPFLALGARRCITSVIRSIELESLVGVLSNFKMMIQMQLKNNKTKEDAAATVIQKHIRRYSATKKVERRRSASFSDTNAIAFRMNANKNKSRKKNLQI